MRARVLMLTAALVLSSWSQSPAMAVEWNRFKEVFISRDGRLIDFLQDEASHSEGQGFAMLLAVVHSDRVGFDLIWRWTHDNLQTRKTDHLFAWKWGKRDTGDWGTLDDNNASDGDLTIAWALLLAHDKWANPEYLALALKIVGDIRNLLTTQFQGRLVLLPGRSGFNSDHGFVLNPSYFLFSAFRKFAVHEQPEFWHRLSRDCLELAARSVFTRLRLPADWVLLNENGVSIARGKSEAFGFDAIRIPLYLSWSGNLASMPQLREYLQLVDRLGYLPRQVNLAQNALSLDEASGGINAVMARVARELGEKAIADRLKARAEQRLAQEGRDYYSQVLALLAAVEWPR